MFDSLVDALQTITSALQANMRFLLMLLAVLWGIQLINWLLGYRLNYLGLIPRNPFGLIGIVTSPFLHGDFNHLFFNSIPLFILSALLLMFGWQTYINVSLCIIFISGILLWFVGRKAIHIGASAVIMGYFSFLVLNAYENPSLVSVIIALVTLYYLGGLISGLLPTEKGVSVEGHLCGFVAGIAANFLLPYLS